MKDVEVHKLFLHTDEGGWLLKAVRGEYTDGAPFGEIYVVGALPGAVRGNHYHPKTTEWFVVVRGQARLLVADPANPDTDRRQIAMGGADHVCVKIPPMVAHAVENVGAGEMLLLALADRPYDPDDTDTLPCEIAGAGQVP